MASGAYTHILRRNESDYKKPDACWPMCAWFNKHLFVKSEWHEEDLHVGAYIRMYIHIPVYTYMHVAIYYFQILLFKLICS